MGRGTQLLLLIKTQKRLLRESFLLGKFDNIRKQRCCMVLLVFPDGEEGPQAGLNLALEGKVSHIPVANNGDAINGS